MTKTVGSVEYYFSIAKQLGSMPSCWHTINSISNDRTPEGKQGSKEIRV